MDLYWICDVTKQAQVAIVRSVLQFLLWAPSCQVENARQLAERLDMTNWPEPAPRAAAPRYLQ